MGSSGGSTPDVGSAPRERVRLRRNPERSDRAGVMKRLGYDGELPKKSPHADKIIRAVGRAEFFDYARSSTEPDIQKLVELFDKYEPLHKLNVMDYCALAGVQFKKLLGEVSAISY